MHKKEDLIFSVTKKDLQFSYFSGSGAGGQHRNRHNNCVRIKHPDSGVTVQATEHKSMIQNKTLAFKRLVGNVKFTNWIKKTAMKLDDKIIPEIEKCNERIRTYNFQQGRVTDHRINLTLYKLDQILNGDLDELIRECKIKL